MAFIKQTFVEGVTVVQASWLNGIQEVVGAGAVAPEYSSEQTYAVGTLVSHDAQLYICTTTIASPEEWNSSHWMATSLQALVSEQKGVYWCTYNATSYTQIDTAKDKDMLPICVYDFTVDGTRYRGTAVYAYISSGDYVFFDCAENGTYIKLYVNSENTWSRELLTPLVPVGRTVNGKALSTNISLNAEDIQYDGSLASHEAGSIGYELKSLNEKDTELESSISNVKGIFWVRGGVTTSQQIDEAITENLYPVLIPSVSVGDSDPMLPYIAKSISWNYDSGTGTTVEIIEYLFQSVMATGACYRQSLTVNQSTGVETWSSVANNQTLATKSSLDNLRNSIAIYYSSSSAYDVGDYVFYSSNLYRCKTQIVTAELFTPSHWEQVVLTDEIIRLDNENVKISDTITTAQIDSLYG